MTGGGNIAWVCVIAGNVIMAVFDIIAGVVAAVVVVVACAATVNTPSGDQSLSIGLVVLTCQKYVLPASSSLNIFMPGVATLASSSGNDISMFSLSLNSYSMAFCCGCQANAGVWSVIVALLAGESICIPDNREPEVVLSRIS